jgi:hypothetical protein
MSAGGMSIRAFVDRIRRKLHPDHLSFIGSGAAIVLIWFGLEGPFGRQVGDLRDNWRSPASAPVAGSNTVERLSRKSPGHSYDFVRPRWRYGRLAFHAPVKPAARRALTPDGTGDRPSPSRNSPHARTLAWGSFCGDIYCCRSEVTCRFNGLNSIRTKPKRASAAPTQQAQTLL